MTNSEKLNNAIAQSGLKKCFIAESLGITFKTLQNKITNVTDFRSTEIVKLSELLHLTDEEAKAIFFCSSLN